MDKRKVIKFLTLLELPLENHISPEQVSNSYRKLCQVFHPDVAHKRYADGKKFIELTEAYNFVSNNIGVINYLIKTGFSESSRHSAEFQRAVKEAVNKKYEQEEKKRAAAANHQSPPDSQPEEPINVENDQQSDVEVEETDNIKRYYWPWWKSAICFVLMLIPAVGAFSIYWLRDNVNKTPGMKNHVLFFIMLLFLLTGSIGFLFAIMGSVVLFFAHMIMCLVLVVAYYCHVNYKPLPIFTPKNR